MIPHHVSYQLVILGLLWLCLMLHSIGPSRDALSPQTLAEPVPQQFKRKLYCAKIGAPHFSARYADRLASMPRWLSTTKRPPFSAYSHAIRGRVYSFCLGDSHYQA